MVMQQTQYSTSSMTQRISKLLLILIVVIFTFTLSSCNKVTTHNFSLIKLGMTKTEVIEILGQPQETYEGLVSTEYLWFDKGNTFYDALDYIKKGKNVKYIEVTFTIELVNGEPYVINKDFGNLKDRV